jgi:hypothetical protein
MPNRSPRADSLVGADAADEADDCGSTHWLIEAGPEPEPEPEPEPQPEPQPSEGGGTSAAFKEYFDELLKEVAGELGNQAVDLSRDAILAAAKKAKTTDPDASVPWWSLIVEQMNTLDYPSDDPRVHAIFQVNLVIELQTWLQENRPQAVAASNAYLATWPNSSRKALTIELIQMDTVLEMAEHMESYTGPDGQRPPFICGSTPLVDAAHVAYG